MHVLRGSRGPEVPSRRTHSRRRVAGSLVALATGAGLLTACSSSSGGVPTLTWYINPDNGGQAAVAAACTKAANGAYKIDTQTLPQDADAAARPARPPPGGPRLRHRPDEPRPAVHRRVRERRLPRTDPARRSSRRSAASRSRAPSAAATWNGKLVAYPFWSNTQVLWYRKSFVQKAGIDMTSRSPGTRSSTPRRQRRHGRRSRPTSTRATSVWINALISGAGGQIVDQRRPGRRRHDRRRLAGGRRRGRGHQRAGPLQGRTARPVGRPARARPARRSGLRTGRSWSTGPTSGTTTTRRSRTSPRTSATPVPRDRRRASRRRPPYGGIDIGVSAYSSHVDRGAQGGRQCIVEPENQGDQRRADRQHAGEPARATSDPKLQKLYPAVLLKLFQQSLDAAAPRPVTPYCSDISSALQSTWHPPAAVNPQTPAEVRDLHRATSSTGGACCEHRYGTEAPTTEPSRKTRRRARDRSARREPARAEAGRRPPSS